MPDNNRRQADVPRGASVIEQRRGTAPGLICPVGRQGRLCGARACPTSSRRCSSAAILPDLRAPSRGRGDDGRDRARGSCGPGASSESGARRGARRLDSATSTATSTHGRVPRIGDRGAQGPPDRPRAAERRAAIARLDAEEATVRAVLLERARRRRVRRRRRDDGARRRARGSSTRASRSRSPSRSPAGSSRRGSSTSPARAAGSAAAS